MVHRLVSGGGRPAAPGGRGAAEVPSDRTARRAGTARRARTARSAPTGRGPATGSTAVLRRVRTVPARGARPPVGPVTSAVARVMARGARTTGRPRAVSGVRAARRRVPVALDPPGAGTVPQRGVVTTDRPSGRVGSARGLGAGRTVARSTAVRIGLPVRAVMSVGHPSGEKGLPVRAAVTVGLRAVRGAGRGPSVQGQAARPNVLVGVPVGASRVLGRRPRVVVAARGAAVATSGVAATSGTNAAARRGRTAGDRASATAAARPPRVPAGRLALLGGTVPSPVSAGATDAPTAPRRAPGRADRPWTAIDAMTGDATERRPVVVSVGPPTVRCAARSVPQALAGLHREPRSRARSAERAVRRSSCASGRRRSTRTWCSASWTGRSVAGCAR